ncbi:hypothetical protein QYE76_036124 [Lolium multiflorum]|uniref:Integrase catalytic domain-containing protein n=1 Tax=Lolium multiflorum TaxID=4521 RepID=A0AAD8R144_LOLMU|nr:hypothetical protein QYE76_036124 [Lolium multiflorum]
MAAPQQQGSPAYVVYKVGGDPGDYQFLYEPPKEIPHGYVCTYVPDCNNWTRAIQTSAGGIAGAGAMVTAGGSSGADAEKQAWLTKYATAMSHESSTPTAPTMDQISAILRDQFGILPKKRTIGYSKPYPNEYDLIPLPPKYRLPDFTKFSGSEGSSSIEHVSRYLAQLGMVSASEPLRVSIDLAGDGKLGYGFTSADELEEIDIGPGDKPRPTFISKKLDPHLRGLMIALLKEYPDCFAWDYTEMPGLDMSIIEHRLPLKKGFRPFQQRARQMKAEILVEVKKEIQKMLDAGFIRTCIFGIPQTITTDGGSVFMSKEMKKFCDDMGIKLIRSSPYYAQANGQAEASNKSLIKLIKRKIDEHPRRWHEVLSEALWAYRMSCHGAIKTSPYQLVYGQEAVLPWEIKAGSRRITFQNDLTAEEYAALMSDIEDATELRLWSLEKIKENKAKVARAYNNKMKPKEFQVGDLVWEAVLPLGTKDKVYGKWSPNWHGPYKVVQVLKGNAYMLEQLDGVKFPVAVNGSISRSISQVCGMMDSKIWRPMHEIGQ